MLIGPLLELSIGNFIRLSFVAVDEAGKAYKHSNIPLKVPEYPGKFENFQVIECFIS